LETNTIQEIARTLYTTSMYELLEQVEENVPEQHLCLLVVIRSLPST
jgi:hypothetical protein